LLIFPLLLAFLADIALVSEVREILAGIVVHDVRPPTGTSGLDVRDNVVLEADGTWEVEFDRQ
jgi:hypothetical protein